MKRSLLFLLSLLSICAVSAQITLTQSTYPFGITGTDSLKVSTYNAVFPAFITGPAVSWDLSGISDSTPVFFDYRVPTITYQYADSNYYSFLSFVYQANIQSSILTTGVVDHGVNILDTAYSISTLTGAATDSIFIPAQNIIYSAQRTKIALPATYNSAWSSTYKYDMGFELSVSIYSYTHAPGIVRSYVSEKDTVTGWGTMRIRDISGAPSAYQNVLQVRSTTIRTDSIFLNGAPMSGAILLLFGVTQGKTDTTYIQNYYRLGEVTPLASAQFKDAGCTQPVRSTTHVQRLYPSGIDDIATPCASVYPNPVKNNKLNITMPCSDGIWQYQLTDIQGRQIAKGQVTILHEKGSIALPETGLQGTYFLQINSDVKKANTIELQIVR